MNCTRAQRCIQVELDGDLSPRLSRALGAHLVGCQRCRHVRAQLLALRAATRELAAASAGSEAAALDFVEPRARHWRAGLAVAAVIALCIGGWLAMSPWARPGGPAPMVKHEPGPPAAPAPDPRSLVRVRFDPAREVITVPVQTEDPNVTIIWVYPTIKTARATRASGAPPLPSS